ncbi:MAG: SIMPL domain-containing protein [Pseudomonadota bacterium]
MRAAARLARAPAGWLAVLALCAVCASATASDRHVNRVQLSSDASEEVPNDRVEVTLHVERQADDIARLNAALNRVVAAAADVVNDEPAVDLQTFPAGSWPHHDPKTGALRHWQGRQRVRLSSDDFVATQAVLQVLQETLAVAQVRYRLSDAAAEAVEDDLIRAALLKLKQRSALIAHEMGMSEVRFDLISVDTGGGAPPVHHGEFVAMARASVDTAPTLEGGSTTVTVRIRADIALLP